MLLRIRKRLPIIVFTLTSLLATTAVDSPQTTALVAFFDTTALSQLKFEDKKSFFMQVDTLQWTTSGLSVAYWRACYSYILCSVIGGFEAGYKNWKEAKEQKHPVINGLTMALTGVKGTGKSVLGSFIALVMAKAFGWRVIYKWGDLTHTIGNSTPTDKVISILDFTSNTMKRSNTYFGLFVSSCNSERWKSEAQQESWDTQGNFVVLDTVPTPELVEMGGRMRGGNDKEMKEVARIAGGVARLCLLPGDDAARSLVDSAVKSLDLLTSVRKLNGLSDPLGTHNGVKLYPGLLVHVVPTDPFRNQFVLQVSSEYVAKSIFAKIEESNTNEIQKLMEDLIAIPKARSFAGLIWEPLFTKKIKSTQGNLQILGSGLPITNSNPTSLFDRSLQELDTFEFKNFEEFKTLFKAWLTKYPSKSSRALLAKALDDNFVAIDAILIFVQSVEKGTDRLVFAGQQMTVAQKSHTLEEGGVKSFAEVAEWALTQFNSGRTDAVELSKEIWFLQPEECLRTFGFAQRQALVFKEKRTPTPTELVPSGRGRKRTRPQHFSEYVTGEPKGQSNNPNYWDKSIQGVKQVVAIAKFNDEAIDDKAAEFAEEVASKLGNNENAPFEFAVIPPELRTWQSTIAAFKRLAETEGMDSGFISVLKEDLETEGKLLEARGYHLEGGDCETHVHDGADPMHTSTSVAGK